MGTVDKISIYQNVVNSLSQRIRSGKCKQGEQFFTERQLAAKFGISRPTANKILASLVSEGLLEFRKGVGTFVNPGVLDYDLRRLVSFTDKARNAGRKPTTRVLKFERLSAEHVDTRLSARLKLEPGDDVFYFERLRLADGEPVILERRYVTARFCPGLNRRVLAGSLYSLWIQRYGLVIGGAEQSIQAINLPASDAKRLRVRTRTAALRVIATGFLASREPLWFEETTYRSDAYEFQAVLSGINGARPAIVRLADIRAS